MSEYNIQMNKYNALNAEYDQLYPATKIENVDGLNIALQNKAPAGYGLGGSYGAVLNDANDAVVDGKYSTNDATTNLPNGVNGAFGVIEVTTVRSDKSITQIFRPGTQGMQPYTLRRLCMNGVWEPWEWVNPPMALGVEYRTTERYLDKPVYRKMVWGGALPNNGYSKVEIASGCVIVQAVCHATSATSASEFTPSSITDIIPWNNNDNNGINMSAFKNFVNLWCKIDRSSKKFVANLWYIKTTD